MQDFTKIKDLDITFMISLAKNFNEKIKTKTEGEFVVGDYSDLKAPSYELLYVLEGDYESTYGDKTVQLKKDSVVFLPKPTDEKKDYKIRIHRKKIINNKETIDIFFNTSAELPDEIFAIDASKNLNIRENFIKIKSDWNVKQPGGYHKCLGHLYSIFADIENLNNVNYITHSQYNRIKPAIDYMYEHCFDRDFDYSELPKLCSIGYSYFKRMFILKFGISPSQFILNAKMSRASELLKSNMYSVTEISEILGFSDIFYFSKVFKNYFGCSPSFYKNQDETKID